MIYIKALVHRTDHRDQMWQPISSAPFNRDLELAVIDKDGPHALVFPCCRILSGWIKVESKQQIEVRPTHWQEWTQAS